MMKRFFFTLAAILAGSCMVMAGGTVMVNTNTSVISWPTNFIDANAIATTGQNTTVSNRVTILENLTNSTSTTNQYIAVSNRVTNLEALTNSYASTNDYVAATNTVVNFTTNLVMATSNSINQTMTGTVSSATNTIWQQTTNLVATATNSGFSTGVTTATNLSYIAMTNKVIASTNTLWQETTNLVTASTNTQYVTMTNYVAGLTNGWTYEYVPFTIYPAVAPFELSFQGPRDETIYLDSLWAQSDAGTAEINLISAASNSLWRAGLTTNTPTTLTIGTVGIVSTNFSPTAITGGIKWGIKVENIYGAQELSVRLKIHR